jgi:hypothetical protein
VVVEHPNYRVGKGAEWSANMHLSMAVGAYILGGQKYLDDMPQHYGKYLDGDLEEIPITSAKDREYIIKNSKITLDELIENWETIRYS